MRLSMGRTGGGQLRFYLFFYYCLLPHSDSLPFFPFFVPLICLSLFPENQDVLHARFWGGSLHVGSGISVVPVPMDRFVSRRGVMTMEDSLRGGGVTAYIAGIEEGRE